MKKETLLVIIHCLLILMFFYAGFSKIADHDAFVRAMGNQPLPKWSRRLIFHFLPLIEIFIGTMIFFERSQRIGLYSYLILMIAFTLYIGAGILNLLAFTPCSCGGVISAMSWPQHLIFNLFFIVINIYAIKYQR